MFGQKVGAGVTDPGDANDYNDYNPVVMSAAVTPPRKPAPRLVADRRTVRQRGTRVLHFTL